LLEMVDGSWKLDRKEVLPEPYIQRCFLQNDINIKFLENIKDDTLIILDGVGNPYFLNDKFPRHTFTEVGDYLNSNTGNCTLHGSKCPHQCGLSFLFCQNRCSLPQFDKICDKNRKKKNCHLLRFRDRDFQWIRSKGDVTELEDYKTSNSF